MLPTSACPQGSSRQRRNAARRSPAALSDLAAESQQENLACRSPRRTDRGNHRASPGRGVCDDRRHATGIRALRSDRADHRRSAVRLVLAFGRRAQHHGVARASHRACGVRGARVCALCETRHHPCLHGGLDGAVARCAKAGSAGQFRIAFGNRRLHRGRGHHHHHNPNPQFHWLASCRKASGFTPSSRISQPTSATRIWPPH